MTDSLLPYQYRDKNNLALENCMKQVLSVDVTDLMINPLENAKEFLLPYLTKEYHIEKNEGLSLADTAEKKRDLIMKFFTYHSQKGGYNAVKQVLTDLNLDAEIAEFWEYGGRPGHYIIKFLNLLNTTITDELENLVTEMIKTAAPLTRTLDYINWVLADDGSYYCLTRIREDETICINTEKEVINE